MLENHVQRLTTQYPDRFSREQAIAVVARAYGYRTLDLASDSLVEPVPGLQLVKPLSEILTLDRMHQMMQFLKMALNISIPSNTTKDLRNGIAEREIVRAMMNFPSFDALINYAKSDPLDPNTTDADMLERFRVRYGYRAAMQYLLGRDNFLHALIVQPDADKAQRIIDQEVTLNPLDGMRVAIVRTDPHGHVWLSVHMNNLPTITGPIGDDYDAKARHALGMERVIVSMIPDSKHSLHELVKAHVNMLAVNSQAGRSLIIDRVPLDLSADDLDAAYAMATDNKLNLVVIVDKPIAELWARSGVRLIFGFPSNIQESNLEMDTMIGFGAPYIGFKRGKMQYLYHSKESGARFAAMDLIPDDSRTKSLLERLKDAIRV